MPQEIFLSWTVAASDSGGLGITGLKSNGWAQYVFMHTSQTPGAVSGVTNPNPADGVVAIRLKQNFNVFLGAQCTALNTVTGEALTSTTTGTTYQIVTVGTTTTAQWVTAGLPVGLTPAAGMTFVAAATASFGGSGTVKAIAAPGFDNFSISGNPTSTIQSNDIGTYHGAYLVGKFILAGSLAAPTAGTVINLRLSFDRSSVTVDGL